MLRRRPAMHLAGCRASVMRLFAAPERSALADTPCALRPPQSPPPPARPPPPPSPPTAPLAVRELGMPPLRCAVALLLHSAAAGGPPVRVGAIRWDNWTAATTDDDPPTRGPPPPTCRPPNAPCHGRPCCANYLCALSGPDSTCNASTPRVPGAVDIFVGGGSRYSFHRIPAMVVAADGSLLVFAQCGGLPANSSDVVLRRSTNLGRSWGDEVLVVAQSTITTARDKASARPIANPAPVVLASGRVLLVCTPGNKEVWTFFSDTHGRTWSGGRNITSQAALPHWDWVATGPPQGIRLMRGPHRGRIVFGADHRAGKTIGSHSIYSDDDGETFRISTLLDASSGPCECQVAQTANGSLVLNARGHDSRRHFAYSTSGGASWSELTSAPFSNLRYGGGYCEGSTVALPGSGLLAFSTPFSPTQRANMSIFISSDNAQFFPIASAISIDRGGSQYSTMQPINSTHVALAYEGGCLGKHSMPCWIRFLLVDVSRGVKAKTDDDRVEWKTDDQKPLAPSPFLPPLLRMDDGKQVLTPGEWPERRAQVAALVQEYLLGTVPPQRPALLSHETLNTTRLPASALSSFVRLTFGDHGVQNVTFDVEMLRPAPSSDRHPLFITMFTHRPWALLGLSRGYAAAIFPGCDGQDIAPAFQQAYNGRYTMALIMARALVASLTLDYALGLDHVATSQVCMTGHSRNGKLSLVAAAFDERITAVVGSSPGAPIATPFRFSSAMYFGQDAVTSPPPSVWFSWWVAKSREYIGRENEMPMDGHGVVGMIAPRAAAIATAWQDRESDLTFGNEQNLRESATVYQLLGAEKNLSLLYRPGDHHGYIDPGSYFDFFDRSFGRRQELAGNDAAGVVARDALISAAGFDWPSWQRLANASRADAPSTSAPLAARIGWLLDHDATIPTTHGASSVPDAYCEEAPPGEYTTLLMDHDRSKKWSSLYSSRYENISHVPFSFGGYLHRQTFHLILPPFRSTDLFSGAGT